MAENWKGTVISIKGRTQTYISDIRPTLYCFNQAEHCNDSQAHCIEIVDDPYLGLSAYGSVSLSINLGQNLGYEHEIARYQMPCSRFARHFRYEKDHPSTIEDQIQSMAVSHACDWCPNFDIKNFKKVGVRTEIRYR